MPLPLFMVHRFFHGVGDELQVNSLPFPTLLYFPGVNDIPGLGSCRFAPVGIQPAQCAGNSTLLPGEPWSEPLPQTQPRAEVWAEGQTLPRP